MISELLIPQLQQRFPGRGLRLSPPPAPFAVFPAIHPEVGEIQIHDDGDEITLVAGNFTHGHFSSYDESLSREQRAEQIAGSVVDFLEELFADRIILWGSHQEGGGWEPVGENSGWEEDEKLYVWSGPLA